MNFLNFGVFWRRTLGGVGQGTAFYKDKDGNRIKVFIKSWIIVNMAYFRQINPNYARL